MCIRDRHLFYAFYKGLQLAAARWMPELAQGLGFDLANALARHLEALPNLFQRVLGAVFQAETHLDHPFLARGERAQNLRGVLPVSYTHLPEIAERLIAEALHPYAPGVVIATKGGNTRPGPARAEPVGRAGYLIQCVEMSLRRLKLDRIDLYQLHRIDPRTPLEESLGALKKMRCV